MPEKFPELRFPLGGIDISDAFGKQPTRQIGEEAWVTTTRMGVNVRACDPRTLRLRGAMRPGLKRFFPLPVVAGYIIQELTFTVTVAEDPVELSNYGRVIDVVAVSQGVVKYARVGDETWSATTNNTGDTPPLNVTGVMFSTSCIQKLWFADGAHWVYYDPTDNSVNRWAATAGFLPEGSDGSLPRLICTWRGRVVLSGIISDSQNWFMSAIGDPTDFDYSPESQTPTQAIAGNNAPQGLVGDTITALIPYSDDVLIFGGDHTIYMMRGDPNDGGQIDLITDAIGMAWGSPWCKDPQGVVYFFSNRCGVLALDPNKGQPIPISQAIDSHLQAVNTGENTIRLIWDDRYQGLHVFVSPTAEPDDTQHYFYEKRTGGWWIDEFANPDHSPLCCVTVDGNEPQDRVPLIGSWDGYVRTLSADANDDDGTPIESSVLIGPILTPDLDDVRFHEVQAVLGAGSGNVNFAVYVGRTAEEALDSSPVVTGVWRAGRNPTNLIARAGYALYLELTASDPWAMETVRAVMRLTGAVRRRGR